ncbi:hypothetical protein L6452_35098 [Arctium lappa]|uniref:Uncharacterized protein n=1 Tax=Arctium lappa TaxID=4217 RepID=A0ACB8YKL7_ARCLA|nr:hypothetical protein L6452_35098 [Arctium lappa]
MMWFFSWFTLLTDIWKFVGMLIGFKSDGVRWWKRLKVNLFVLDIWNGCVVVCLLVTVPVNPKPFLNNLTGKLVIVKLKWEWSTETKALTKHQREDVERCVSEPTNSHHDFASVSLKIPFTDLDNSSSKASIKSPNLLHLSISLPTPPPETDFSSGLPLGAIEAIKATYGGVVHILDS